MHSLPSYHGAFVAIWVGVPALVLVLLWLLFQGSVIDGLLLAQPARRADRRRRRRRSRSLLLSEIHNVAAGRIFAEPSPEIAAAAERLIALAAHRARRAVRRRARADARSASSSPARRLAPRFRARNGVERVLDRSS